jgi:hypothetical protein
MANDIDNWEFLKTAKGSTWRDEFQVAQSAFVKEIISALAKLVTQSGGTVHAARITNGLNYHTVSGTHVEFAVMLINAGSHPYIEIAVERNPKTIKSKKIADMTGAQIAAWLWKKFPQGLKA